MKDTGWSEKLSVGNKTIDGQHQYLINLMSQIIFSRKNKRDLVYINGVIHKLYEYAVLHFFTEEDLMKQLDYPNYESHKKEHEFFIKELEKFEKEALEGNVYVNFEIMIFLKKWLINHIQVTDKDLMPYFFNEDES